MGQRHTSSLVKIAILASVLLSPAAQAQTGQIMNDLYLKMKASNFDPESSQKAFNSSFQEANDAAIQNATASYTASAREALKKNGGWGLKNKKDPTNPLGKKDAKKPAPVEQMETAAKGKGYNRENVNTGMSAGAEAGAQTVTFGNPSKTAPEQPPKKKFKFE